jgi:hypothetical protein
MPWLVLPVKSTLSESACSHTRLSVQVVGWLQGKEHTGKEHTNSSKHSTAVHSICSQGFLESLALCPLGHWQAPGLHLACVWVPRGLRLWHCLSIYTMHAGSIQGSRLAGRL